MQTQSNLDIYTVSQLNQSVKQLLEETLSTLWVEGEISNFAAPHSGHWYFCLKDASAQVRCAMFRMNQRQLGFTPKDGAQVLARAKVSLYPNRGEFQLIVDFMEERGEGKLRRAYELLKKKLEGAGLFDPVHKKPLPAFPKQIGIVTSPTGAAIRDILTVLKRRFPCVPVIIYKTLVQGDTAAAMIASAIQTANQRAECDVLIVGRGGGSLEDLWPFNEEVVAQAIFASHIPIISAVGHEVDFTIADFVADLRAPTPSAAAELVVPDQVHLLQTLTKYQQHILKNLQNRLTSLKQHLNWLNKHLQQQHPKRRLLEKMQQLDYCELTLVKLQSQRINQYQTKLNEIEKRLLKHSPSLTIQRFKHQLALLNQTLISQITALTEKKQTALANAAATLDALSPLATLQRGYALVSTTDKRIVKTISQVIVGDHLQVSLSNGVLGCTVNQIQKKYKD